jgi:hypothetical protein
MWRLNLSAPWPTDPKQTLELEEKMWAMIDGLIKKGEIEEFGVFPDGYTGYLISKGTAEDFLRNTESFLPFVISEPHEIIPYEKNKEIARAMLKAQIAAMKK